MKKLFLLCLLAVGAVAAQAQPYYDIDPLPPHICGSYTIEAYVVAAGTCSPVYRLADVAMGPAPSAPSNLDLSLGSNWFSGSVPSCGGCTFEPYSMTITDDCIPLGTGTGPSGFPYDQASIYSPTCFAPGLEDAFMERSCTPCPGSGPITHIHFDPNGPNIHVIIN